MATHSSVLGLENPRDGGAWWAAVYGVVQSRTRLKRLSSSSRLTFNGLAHLLINVVFWGYLLCTGHCGSIKLVAENNINSSFLLMELTVY